MALLSDITSRVRLELADLPALFQQTIIADGGTTYALDYYPVDATTVTATVDGVSAGCAVEERTGRLVMNSAPTAGASIVVQGTHYRYFALTDLNTISDAAAAQHLVNRTDQFGRAVTLANIPSVEIYPVALLATVQALWALTTDAAFDIDISTPDGVSIPRSERFRQLSEMAASRQEQYKQLCEALNIGMYRIDIFTLRRIAKSTGRYVPVFQPQEIDDYGMPQRIYLPMPLYGGTPLPQTAAQYDLAMMQGDTFAQQVDFDFDITNYTIAAQIRTYAQNPAIAAQLAITVVNAAAGTFIISLTPAITLTLPLHGVWDLQVTNNLDATDVRTLIQGQVVVDRQVTR